MIYPMGDPSWQHCVDVVEPHVVRLTTPAGQGTGFLVHRRDGWVVVATARHVVADAYEWGLPIKVHWKNLDAETVPVADRVLRVHRERDSAVLAWRVDPSVAPILPAEPLTLVADKSFVRVGVTVGWLGFPGLVEGGARCCFFSGSVSALVDRRYFVDGVAINGVSGGPAFCPTNDGNIIIVGSISEYWPNWQGGGSLPGLLVADDISASNLLKDVVDRILKSIPTE